MKLIYIGGFGLFGIYARYLLSALNGAFPHGTLTINVLGSFLIGAVYALGVEKSSIPADLRIGLMVGLMGGFTTFSAFCLETIQLVNEGKPGQAALYVALSNILGLLAVMAGLALARNVAH